MSCPVCGPVCELEREERDFQRLLEVAPINDDAALRYVETVGRARVALEALAARHARELAGVAA